MAREVIIHEVARLEIKIGAIHRDGRVEIDVEEHNLLTAAGSVRVSSRRYGVLYGDSVKLTVKIDSDSVRELAKREVALGG